MLDSLSNWFKSDPGPLKLNPKITWLLPCKKKTVVRNARLIQPNSQFFQNSHLRFSIFQTHLSIQNVINCFRLWSLRQLQAELGHKWARSVHKVVPDHWYESRVFGRDVGGAGQVLHHAVFIVTSFVLRVTIPKEINHGVGIQVESVKDTELWCEWHGRHSWMSERRWE